MREEGEGISCMFRSQLWAVAADVTSPVYWGKEHEWCTGVLPEIWDPMKAYNIGPIKTTHCRPEVYITYSIL